LGVCFFFVVFFFGISFVRFFGGGGGGGGVGVLSLCKMFEGMSQALWKIACGSRTLRFCRCLQGSRVMKSESVISYWRKLLPFLQSKHSNTSPFICTFSVNTNNCPCVCTLICTLCRLQLSLYTEFNA
jgi:hypothetical protein